LIRFECLSVYLRIQHVGCGVMVVILDSAGELFVPPSYLGVISLVDVSEQEFLEVKLRIPKRVDAWFRSHYENVEEQYRGELLDSLRATLDALGEDCLDEEGKEVWQFLEEMLRQEGLYIRLR